METMGIAAKTLLSFAAIKDLQGQLHIGGLVMDNGRDFLVNCESSCDFNNFVCNCLASMSLWEGLCFQNPGATLPGRGDVVCRHRDVRFCGYTCPDVGSKCNRGGFCLQLLSELFLPELVLMVKNCSNVGSAWDLATRFQVGHELPEPITLNCAKWLQVQS